MTQVLKDNLKKWYNEQVSLLNKELKDLKKQSEKDIENIPQYTIEGKKMSKYEKDEYKKSILKDLSLKEIQINNKYRDIKTKGICDILNIDESELIDIYDLKPDVDSDDYNLWKMREDARLNYICTGELPSFYQIGDSFFSRDLSYTDESKGEYVVTKLSDKTVTQRYGKDFINNIPFYVNYRCVPSHDDYKPFIGKSFNSYHPLPVEPKEGDWSNWKSLIEHIGGDKSDILLDYLIILLRYPLQKLPVLALVSKENKTGKSTFINGILNILGKNAGMFQQADLNNNFNAGWATKLVAGFEETSSTQPAANKIKCMTTAPTIQVNEKFVPSYSINTFVKLMIASNHEDDGLYLDDEDTRYFVIKVPKIKSHDADFNSKLIKEEPAFLHYLLNATPKNQRRDRMWFTSDQIRTKQMEVMIESNRSPLYGNIRATVNDIMLTHEKTELLASRGEIEEWLNFKSSRSEITKCLHKEFKIVPEKKKYTPLQGEYKSAWVYKFELTDY